MTSSKILKKTYGPLKNVEVMSHGDLMYILDSISCYTGTAAVSLGLTFVNRYRSGEGVIFSQSYQQGSSQFVLQFNLFKRP